MKVLTVTTWSFSSNLCILGPIYLFRVALTIITLCKRPLMSMDPAKIHPGTVMELLSRPSPSFIPHDPEAFINHTFTVKIRDDDLRKQRSKREAQWKKDRLAQR
jgi:TBC1 domain family member 10